ncbi:MAG: hypothetical protein GY856_22105 [bacterium]|nr:hypothetical protein [bacterium]
MPRRRESPGTGPAGDHGSEERSSASLVFTEYVRSLGPGGEPPDRAAYEELLKHLRAKLVRELKKRSLWSAPPSYLGIYGGTRWTDGDLLEELLLDCYEFIFIRRLEGLKKQLLVRRSIEGLIPLNIRHLLYEAQKRHDPLGFQIFKAVQTTVLRLLDDGVLYLLTGDPRVRNDTVLGFTAWGDPETVGGVGLGPQVKVWSNQLLPELITGKNREDVLAELERLIRRLPDEDVEVFRFKDLIEPLKEEARARWRAIQLGSADAPCAKEGDGTLAPVVRLVRPDRGFEERQSFRKLLACVAERIESLEARKATKEYLRRLWLYLVSWIGEPEEPAARPSGRVRGRPSCWRRPAPSRWSGSSSTTMRPTGGGCWWSRSTTIPWRAAATSPLRRTPKDASSTSAAPMQAGSTPKPSTSSSGPASSTRSCSSGRGVSGPRSGRKRWSPRSSRRTWTPIRSTRAGCNR